MVRVDVTMEIGEVAVIDLGGAALIVPGGSAAAKPRFVTLRDRYQAGLDAIDDPDLVDQ